jgi:hypothetical protein
MTGAMLRRRVLIPVDVSCSVWTWRTYIPCFAPAGVWTGRFLV